jgi:hypothetical protein
VQQELFYKLVVTNIASYHINKNKTVLQNELNELANDPILVKRRFRMLSQLSDYESQLYKKIYQFCSDDINDYVLAAKQIVQEINNVVDRSG